MSADYVHKVGWGLPYFDIMLIIKIKMTMLLRKRTFVKYNVCIFPDCTV